MLRFALFGQIKECHVECDDSLYLLIFFSSELLCAVIKELLVHLHEKFQRIVNQAMYGPVQSKG